MLARPPSPQAWPPGHEPWPRAAGIKYAIHLPTRARVRTRLSGVFRIDFYVAFREVATPNGLLKSPLPQPHPDFNLT